MESGSLKVLITNAVKQNTVLSATTGTVREKASGEGNVLHYDTHKCQARSFCFANLSINDITKTLAFRILSQSLPATHPSPSQ